MNKDRTTARIVGAIYIAGFVVGIPGNMLAQSDLGSANHLSALTAHSMTVAIGAILWLMAVAGDAAHGVLMFPILKRHSERIAIGYLTSRIIDAVFIAVMVLFILMQLPLGREYLSATSAESHQLSALSNAFMEASRYSYDIAMATLGIAGWMLCYTFFKTRLLPRWIAVWGLAGYAVIFIGMVSDIMGSGLGLASSIPGGLWEMYVGVFLIVKGFDTSPVV
jgi:hypothetical protein